ARRGGILDVYAAGSADPLRIEFDGDIIASIRRFDAGTQRSLEQLGDATVLPRYEVALTPEEAAAASERLRAAEDALALDGARREPGIGAPADGRPDTTPSRHLFHDGMERFYGHYDPSPGCLADYLPPDTLVLLDDPGRLDQRLEELERLIA